MKYTMSEAVAKICSLGEQSMQSDSSSSLTILKLSIHVKQCRTTTWCNAVANHLAVLQNGFLLSFSTLQGAGICLCNLGMTLIAPHS